MASNKIKARVVKQSDGTSKITYYKSGTPVRERTVTSSGGSSSRSLVTPSSEQREAYAKTQGGKTGVPVVVKRGETTEAAVQRSADKTAALVRGDVGVTMSQQQTGQRRTTSVYEDERLSGTGYISPDQATRGLTLKQKEVSQQELVQRSSMLGSTPGAIRYESEGVVVGVYDPRTNERIVSGFWEPKPEPKSQWQKFVESPEATAGEQLTAIIPNRQLGRGLTYEEAKDVWGRNPAIKLGQNIQAQSEKDVTWWNAPTKFQSKVTGAIVEDVGRSPFKNVALFGAGRVVGYGVGGAKALYTGGKVATRVAAAPKVAKWMGRGTVIGAGSLAGGTLAGVAGVDIIKSGDPIGRAAVIGKDVVLFDAGFRTNYAQGFAGATQLKANVKTKVDAWKFERVLIRNERLAADPQRLPYRFTKDAATGRNVLVEEVDTFAYADTTSFPKSPLGLPRPVSSRLNRRYQSDLTIPSEDLPTGVRGSTKEVPLSSFSKAEVYDLRTGKTIKVEESGLGDVLSEKRYVYVEPARIRVTPKRPDYIEIRPVETQKKLTAFGFQGGKKGQFMFSRSQYYTESNFATYKPRFTRRTPSKENLGGGTRVGGRGIIRPNFYTGTFTGTTAGLALGQSSSLQPGFKNITGTGIDNTFKTNQRPFQRTRFGVAQDVVPTQATSSLGITAIDIGGGSFTGKTSSSTETSKPKPPKTKVPKLPEIIFDFKDELIKRKKTKRIYRASSKYTPSVTAVAFNIRGKKPAGARSGLVLRPISK